MSIEIDITTDLKMARDLSRSLEVDDELERLVRWNERLAGRVPTEREIEEWLEAARAPRRP